MEITISKDSNESVYRQIYSRIREKIFSREILNGERMISERKLAENLGVNRSTVVSAYELLKEEGLVETVRGKGTFVRFETDSKEENGGLSTCYDWARCFSEKSKTRYDEIIRLIMDENNRSGKCFFAGGLPSPSLIPADQLQKHLFKLVSQKSMDMFFHSPVQGTFELRMQIKQLMKKRGVTAKLNEQLITSGSQQALDLVVRSFVCEGDVVIVEEPTFFGALQLFKQAGAKVIGVPMDSGGMNVDILEYLIRTHNPKIIYTIPTFHNPTGTVMSESRRRKLVEISNAYKVPIIEDDPYGELNFEGVKINTLKSMDKSNYVIYISTFSKTVSLGLRIGWIVASKEAINCLKKVKQLTDLHVNTLNQHMMGEYLASLEYERHVGRIVGEYKKKRDIMAKCLDRCFKLVSYEVAAGGYYLWVEFWDDIDVKELFEAAYREKVVITPGYHFSSDLKGCKNKIRLNFTYPDEEEIVKGIEKLSECYEKIKEKRR